MITNKYKIKYDINIRQATNIAYKLQTIKADVYFLYDDRSINAKSILGLLSAGIKKEDSIEIKTLSNDNTLINSIINILDNEI